MYERIVVALDGSDSAEEALRHGEELARLTGAPLHLIRVADVTIFHFAVNEAAAAYATLSDDLEREEREAKEYLEGVRARLAERGVTATTAVRRGLAGHVLVEATQPGDLLVLASHGRTGLRRWLLGEVAEEITRHATVPVLLVRATPSPDG